MALTVVGGIAWLSLGALDGVNDPDRGSVVDLATILNRERDANRVRMLIWDAVPQALSTSSWTASGAPVERWRPLVGFGQETTWLALERWYPPGLAHVEGWQSLPDRAHNQVLEVLLTRGLVGALCYLVTAALLLATGLRASGLVSGPGSMWRFLAALGVGSGVGMSAGFVASGGWGLGAVGLIPGMVAGAIGYLVLRVERTIGADARLPLRQRWLALALTGAIAANLVESQFGIAVTASQAHYWLLAGALVALRYRGLRTSAAQIRSAEAPARSAGDGTVDGLLTGAMLVSLIFGLMTPDTAVFKVAFIIAGAMWIAGWALSWRCAPAAIPLSTHATRFWLASGIVGVAFAGFHKLLLVSARGLQLSGDDLGSAAAFAALFDGYHAWMLAIAVVVAAVRSSTRAEDAANSTPLRTLLALVILLPLGLALPRATHVVAVRADILAARAEAAQRRGRYASAGSLFRQAIDLRDGELYYRTGAAALQVDWAVGAPVELRDRRLRRAARQLRATLQSERATAKEHANLARLYTLWGERDADPATRAARYSRADRHYRDAIERRPNSARYYAEWGRLSVLQGSLDPARDRFGRSLALDPTQGQTYLWVRPLLAADLLEAPDALAELGPESADIPAAQIHTALIEHFIQAEELEAAIEAALRLTETIPEQPLGHWTLAGLYSRLGRPAEGLPHAWRAHERALGSERRQIAQLINRLQDAAARAPS